MNCRDIKENMVSFLEGEFSGDEAKVYEEHLATCADCREEVEVHRKTWQLLGEWEDIEPSPSFKADFWKAVERDPEARSIGEPNWWQRVSNGFSAIFNFRVPAWGVVALLMVALFVGHFSFPRVEEKVVIKEVPKVQVVYTQAPNELVASLPSTVVTTSSESISPMSDVVNESQKGADVGDLPEPPEELESGTPLNRIDLDFLMEGTKS